mmetsp:Transcript_124663/g.216118  ORF Transcript_124663/g.216118 Transcript_124663/m.216118 type:complete len:102 (-) Transcript_124663:1265-1570(-)
MLPLNTQIHGIMIGQWQLAESCRSSQMIWEMCSANTCGRMGRQSVLAAKGKQAKMVTGPMQMQHSIPLHQVLKMQRQTEQILLQLLPGQQLLLSLLSQVQG